MRNGHPVIGCFALAAVIAGPLLMLGLAPLRELVPELAEQLRKVRLRERRARALRQAADVIDPPTPVR